MTEASSSATAGAAPLDAVMITMSFRGDFEMCRLLCESIDRFVPEEIAHRLVVPTRDLDLFGRFASARRTIVSEDTLLPRWFCKAPLPGPRWRRLLHLPRRDVYLTPFSLPVRGWIAQQIMKIAATAAATAEIVVHVDSDNAFVRPFGLEHLVHAGRVRLYRDPVRVDLASHRRWHRAASGLLGLPIEDFQGAEYIDALVVWRRSVLRSAIERIEAVSGRDWRSTLARTPHFAEYILYGVHADRIVGLDAAGLFPTATSLCHARWSDGFADATDVDAFVHGLGRDRVSCLLQSTLKVSIEERRRIFERVVDVATAQDRGEV